MGHSGTLDPLASGLLIVAVGDATKRLKDLIGLPKTYIAEIILGKKTDTGDMEGKIVEEKSVPKLDENKIKNVLESIKGEIDLQVPLYSAIKISGKPLYKYAKEGKRVIPPVKKMKINKAELISFNKNLLKLKLEVGSGAYIRSIAEEIGRKLGTVAVLSNLRRIKIGKFNVENAEKI